MTRDLFPPDEYLAWWATEHRGVIVGCLFVEYAESLSDSELVRVLSPRVGGHILVPAAQYLRDTGALSETDIDAGSARERREQRRREYWQEAQP